MELEQRPRCPPSGEQKKRMISMALKTMTNFIMSNHIYRLGASSTYRRRVAHWTPNNYNPGRDNNEEVGQDIPPDDEEQRNSYNHVCG